MKGLHTWYAAFFLIVPILFLGACDQKPNGPAVPLDSTDLADTLDPSDTGQSGGIPVPEGNYFPIAPGSRWSYWDGYGVNLEYKIERDTLIDGKIWSIQEYSNRRPRYIRREGMTWYAIDSNVGVPFVYLNLNEIGTGWLVHYMNPGGDSSHDRSWFEVDEYLPTYEVEGLRYHDVIRITETKEGRFGLDWKNTLSAEIYFAKDVGLIEHLSGRYGLNRFRVLLDHHAAGENATVDTTEQFDTDRVKGGWFYALLDGEEWIPESISYIDEGPETWKRHEIWAWQWPGRYGAHVRFMLDSLQPGVYELGQWADNSVDFYIHQSLIYKSISGSVKITRNDAFRIEGTFSFLMTGDRSFSNGEFYIEK